MTEINQQLSNKAAIIYKNRLSDKSLRKARTRTLIQAGGLLGMIGFFSICNIEEGDDLQFDFKNRDKAAILLGILSEAFENLPQDPTDLQKEHWQSTGVTIMKMRKSNL